jgi:hypothetical protein
MSTALTKTKGPSEDELLRTAKKEYAAGDAAFDNSTDHYKTATEAVFQAVKVWHTAQAKIAAGTGKSAQAIGLYLKWKRNGFPGISPFAAHHKLAKAKKEKAKATEAVREKLQHIADYHGDAAEAKLLKEVGGASKLEDVAPEKIAKLVAACDDYVIDTKPTMQPVTTTRSVPIAATTSDVAEAEFAYAARNWLPKMSADAKARSIALVKKLAQ